jgi:hypothetical protein
MRGTEQNSTVVSNCCRSFQTMSLPKLTSSTFLLHPRALLSHVGPLTMTIIHSPTMKKPACANLDVGQYCLSRALRLPKQILP